MPGDQPRIRRKPLLRKMERSLMSTGRKFVAIASLLKIAIADVSISDSLTGKLYWLPVK